MIFAIVFPLVFLLGIAGMIYLGLRIHKFAFVRKWKWAGWLFSFAVCPVTVWLLVWLTGMSVFNLAVILLHLVIFWLLCDLGWWIAGKIRKKQPRRYYGGLAALVLTVVYLGTGWFFAHHVFVTEYDLTTTKDVGEELCIVQISDSHLGTTLSGQRFAEELEKVQSQNPDVVVITGDFVDDDTSKEDMLTACRALGKLKTTYGVYFVYGNHDEGYFRRGTFTPGELVQAMTANGVIILEDETVLIDDRFYLIGRNDASDRKRLSMEELTADLDTGKYLLVLDHQPTDFEAETAAKADLTLCGHTHGGHIFPAGLVGIWFGGNDLCYGLETRQDSAFIVSSGISGWAIPFKTGCISEIVVIRVSGS